MNPAYLLALKLGIPVIVQPEWDACQKLLDEGRKLVCKGRKLTEEGHKILDKEWKAWEETKKIRRDGNGLRREGWEPWDEGRKLIKKGQERCNKSPRLYRKAVARELGPRYVLKIDWKTGEVRP